MDSIHILYSVHIVCLLYVVVILSLGDMKLRASLNTTEVQAQANALGTTIDKQEQATQQQMFRMAALATSAFSLFGGALGQTYALAIQLGVNLLRFHSAAAAARVAGGLNPIAAAQAIASGLAVANLGVAIVQLERGEAEAAAQSQRQASFLTILSVYSLFPITIILIIIRWYK